MFAACVHYIRVSLSLSAISLSPLHLPVTMCFIVLRCLLSVSRCSYQRRRTVRMRDKLDYFYRHCAPPFGFLSSLRINELYVLRLISSTRKCGLFASSRAISIAIFCRASASSRPTLPPPATNWSRAAVSLGASLLGQQQLNQIAFFVCTFLCIFSFSFFISRAYLYNC